MTPAATPRRRARSIQSIMGTDQDYQLTRAVDMLRGMSLFSGRMVD